LPIAAGLPGFLVIDPLPFVWRQGAITTGALYVAILILTTQRRNDQFSTQRGQLMLELAIYQAMIVAAGIRTYSRRRT
jgi:uncharacterized membrane protein